MERFDLLIINRSFWPNYPVIGEGLMRLAENLSSYKKVAIILQDRDNIKKNAKKFNRGNRVNFFPIYAISNSSSGLLKRIIDAFFFMFWVILCLIITRPKNIYVSTDPPILIPFIVAVFSKIIKAKYIYHLQDIHPEATNSIKKINKYILKFFKKIDNFTINNSNEIITLNDAMKKEIISRSKTKTEIAIIENPSVPFNNISNKKIKGFSFTGNLGRAQRIPLLINSINKYEQNGGNLKFEFAGSGLFSNRIKKLSKTNGLVKYHGLVSSDKAINISSRNEWALVSIEDEITKYSFPSKISSYVCSGAKILAVCGENTTVAKWVKSNHIGVIVNPRTEDLVNVLFAIENGRINNFFLDPDKTGLKQKFDMDTFVNYIELKIISLFNE